MYSDSRAKVWRYIVDYLFSFSFTRVLNESIKVHDVLHLRWYCKPIMYYGTYIYIYIQPYADCMIGNEKFYPSGKFEET